VAESKNVGERLARVETRLKAVEDDIKEGRKDNEAIMSKLNKIDKEFSRYRGFVGGILLMATAIGTFIKLFGGSIADFFSK